MRELLPDAVVNRIIHKVAGAYVCAYEIRHRSGLAVQPRSAPVPQAG
jgi:hypothetical protein